MIKHLIIVIGVLAIASLGFANEYPSWTENDVPAVDVGLIDNGDALISELPGIVPAWHALEMLTLEQRINSNIEIVLESNASAEAVQKAAEIEALWNGGQFDQALTLFPVLENLADILGIGNAWRTPVATEEICTWGDDVRIGNRDSILVTAMDIHRPSGNLFAALLFEGDNAAGHWTANMSSNGGVTWVETYDFTGAQLVTSLDAAVVSSHFYVTYNFGTDRSDVSIRQFRVTDGQHERFADNSLFIHVFTVTSPDSVQEVALTTNHDYYNNRIYVLAITAQGNLRYFWDDPYCTSFVEIPTNVTNADRGLAVTCNENYGSTYLYASYYDTGNNLQVEGVNTGDVWNNYFTRTVGTSNPKYTTISAWDDTVFSLFEFDVDYFYCRYYISYNGGGTWYWGTVDDTLTRSERPAVTLREGGGIGITYRYYTPVRQQRFNSRTYAYEVWGPHDLVSDHEPYYNQASIEYLGNGNFGVIYLSWLNPVRAAYFDCVDFQTSIGELGEVLPASMELSQNYPNPFNASTAISYDLPKASSVQLEIYDILGRRVATLVNGEQQAGHYQIVWDAGDMSSGVYFYKLRAEDRTETRKMILMK